MKCFHIYKRLDSHSKIRSICGLRPDTHYSIKGLLRTLAVRPLLLYLSETGPFLMFEHTCLCSIGTTWMENFVDNSEVRCKVSHPTAHPLKHAVNVVSLMCLGLDLCISAERLSHCTLVSR